MAADPARTTDLPAALAAAERRADEEMARRRRAEATAGRYAELCMRAPVGIFVADAAGRCEFVNARWCEIAGVSREQALGAGWQQALHPDDRARVIAAWEAAVRQQNVFGSIEYRFRTPAGLVTWLQGHAEILRDATGAVTGYIGTVTDITSRVQANEALQLRDRELRRSQRELTDFLENGAIGLQWLGPDGRVLWANQALLDLLGYTREEYFGHAIAEFHVDLDILHGIHARLLRGETVRDLEVRLLRKGGSIVHVAVDANALFEEQRFVHTRCFLRDISDRKRVEAERDLMMAREQAARQAAEQQQAQLTDALRRYDETVALLEATLTTAPAGMALVDRDLRYVRINPALAAMNGIPVEATLGKPIDELIRPIAEEVNAMYRRVFQTGEPVIGWEVQGERPGETEGPRTWRVDYYPVKMPDGSVPWVGAIVVDITEQKEIQRERERLLARAEAARQEAEAASRLKDDFLATMSHELRTPLTAVLGWVHLLLVRPPEPSLLERGLQAIARNARAQAQLVDDILDVSRIVTGKLALKMRTIDLDAAVAAAVDVVRPTAEAKGIALDVGLDPAAGTLIADPDRLQQIVWNLLSNAVKFTPPGGHIGVRTERAGNRSTIAVSDSGTGIPQEFLPHLWERFRQADSSTTRRHGGLGLGLAIVRHLVEAHGGTVRASSLGAHQGATFTIELPCCAGDPGVEARHADGPRSHRARSGTEASTTPDLGGLRVLVVDDEADTCEVMGLLLMDHGAEVHTARSASEALVAMRTFRPEVLISDIAMPAMDGYGLLARLRELPEEEGGRIPAIALTAYARAEDRVKALQSGFAVHLPKPVSADELVLAIANLAGLLPAP